MQSSDAVANIQSTIEMVQLAFKSLSKDSEDVLEFINNNVEPQLIDYEDLEEKYYGDSNFVSSMSEEIASMSEEPAAT